MAYGDPPGSFPWLPRVLATPEGWVRLAEAGEPVPVYRCVQCDHPWSGDVWFQCDGCGTKLIPNPDFPPLTFRPEEWRMAGNEEMARRLEVLARAHSMVPVISSMPEAEPADDIMSAVRAVARGS